MAIDTGNLLTALALGIASGGVIEALLWVYLPRDGGLKRIDRYLVLLASVLVALLPFLLDRNAASADLLLKAGWGEVFLLFSIIDLKSRRVPNELVLAFSTIGLALALAGLGPSLQSSIYGLVVGFFFFFLLSLFWKGGMGFGDVKFAAMSGAVLGFPDVFWALLWGLVAGGIVAAVLLLAGKVSRKDKFPYVPPLAAGIWLYMLLSA